MSGAEGYTMEETSPVKTSVAKLAGKFKGHVLPVASTEAVTTNPVRKIPLPSLQLPEHTDGGCGEEKPAIVSAHPPKTKLKSSPFIEKLQANLTLTPTPLLTIQKSPEGKLQAPPLCVISPCGSPGSSLRPPPDNEDEVPVSFEQPAEGTAPLHNINKNRVRLSFKRRLPTRQHRKSTGEDPREAGSAPSCPHGPDENGDDGEVFSASQEEAGLNLQDSSHAARDQAAQPHEGPRSDDCAGVWVSEAPSQGQGRDAAVAGSPDTGSASDTTDVQQEDILHEDQRPEQMEGVEVARGVKGEVRGEVRGEVGGGGEKRAATSVC